jgi:hypothetical protein
MRQSFGRAGFRTGIVSAGCPPGPSCSPEAAGRHRQARLAGTGLQRSTAKQTEPRLPDYQPCRWVVNWLFGRDGSSTAHNVHPLGQSIAPVTSNNSSERLLTTRQIRSPSQ